MNLDNFIVPCRNPINVTTRNGESITVPCGHCPDCIEKKANYGESICKELSNAYRFCVMSTLTYDERFVPKMVLIQYREGVSCQDITERPIKTPGIFGNYKKITKKYGKRLYFIPGLQMDTDELFNQFYKKANTFHDGSTTYLDSTKCRVLRYSDNSDFQKFIKRLRFYISREFDCSISYYGCSEYGPESFRPHFHVLIYFNDSRLSSRLEGYINKSWTYGIAYTELADKRGSCGSYLASYLNSYCSLPYYLNFKAVRPKSFHSRTNDLSNFETYRDYLYSNPDRIPYTFDFVNRDTVFQWYPSSYRLRVLFPRCYDYSNKTYRERKYLYTLYNRISKKTGFTKSSEIARYILFHEPYILRKLDIVSFNKNYCPINKRHLFIEHYLPGSDDDYSISVYSRVYNAVNISRHFCQDICDERFTVDYCFDVINDFYDRFPLIMLRNMYESMIDYYDKTESDDYSLFYNYSSLLGCDFEAYLKRHPYSRSVFAFRDSRQKERVKKKIQNDLNAIFTQPIINS